MSEGPMDKKLSKRKGIGRKYDNFTQLLRLLNTKDSKAIDHLKGKFSHKYMHNDSQNEFLGVTLQEKKNSCLTKICE